MANQLGIVHPGLMDRVYLHTTNSLYPSLCTIQTFTTTRSAAGATVQAWATLADHDDLPCRIAPASGGENRTHELIYAVRGWTVAIKGAYAGIQEKMRAVIAGVEYDIEASQIDGNGINTRLQVREVIR